jgi:membrane protein
MRAREWIAIVRRAGRRTIDDHMILIAKALAFSTFLAIPSVLLVVVGLFTLAAEAGTIDSLIAHLQGEMPVQARRLLSDSLHRLDHQPNASLAITVIGFVIAVWSTTSAMANYMTALDIAYHRTDSRGFVRRRLVALAMVACLGLAFLLIAGLLIFGPTAERHVGRAVGHESAVAYLWWTVQWPILGLGLLAAFAAMLYLGPDVEERSWRMATPGAVIAAVVWLAASGAFAFYTAHFDSYNRAWGSLSAVIVTLTWLWLTGLALLFGAELDSEIEALAQRRHGRPRAIRARPGDGSPST